MNAPYSPPGRGSGRNTPGPIWIAVILTALVALAAFGLWYRSRHVAVPVAANTASPAAQELVLAGPAARFVWPRDAQADVYRIETYDASHHLLAAAVLRDTSIAASVLLPDSAKAGTWRVVIVTRGGAELHPVPPAPFRRE